MCVFSACHACDVAPGGAANLPKEREEMRKSPFAVGAVATLLAFGASAAGASTAEASTEIGRAHV